MYTLQDVDADTERLTSESGVHGDYTAQSKSQSAKEVCMYSQGPPLYFDIQLANFRWVYDDFRDKRYLTAAPSCIGHMWLLAKRQ